MHSDPRVKLSVTVPYSISAGLEAALVAGVVTNRSQAVSEALGTWLDGLTEQRLRSTFKLLTEEDNPDEDYAVLRDRTPAQDQP